VRVLIDTNIILDFLLQREPFFYDAELLFQAIETDRIIGYVTATTLTDIFYIARKYTRSIDKARQAISEILTVMLICPVNRAVLKSAFDSGFVDFEDAVQIFCAVDRGLDAIATRDTKGFLNSSVLVLSIQELLVRSRKS
jgi:predicted nucleic acid-binding protein